MNKIVFKAIVFMLFGFLFSSCDEVDADCKCYDNALKGNDLTEECTELVDGLSDEDLKEKSNECFGQTVEDMSGAVGL